MTPRHATLDAVVARLQPGMRVFVPGVSGESQAFFEALTRNPEKADGVCFVGIHFPGINTNDYLGLHPNARQRAYFMQPHLRAPLRDGRVDLIPADYQGVLKDLERLSIDLAVAQVSAPDAGGVMSLGLSYDFLPSVWQRAGLKVAHVNPALPATRGSFRIREDECDLVCGESSPILEYDGGAPSPDLLQLGRHVASVVRDGDTLQFGVGKIQNGILQALGGHRHLRVYSGMVSAEVLPLIDGGSISGRSAIEAGVALGHQAFYERIAADETFYFRPASETHDVRRIASIPGFVAINAALEIDLLGQVNSESLDGALLAGVGGMPAFVQGARLSEGGRSIFCLSATAAKGQLSRIVPRLGATSLVASPRFALDIVATEHGLANLQGLNMDERAERLIALAAPRFREELASAWRDIRTRL